MPFDAAIKRARLQVDEIDRLLTLLEGAQKQIEQKYIGGANCIADVIASIPELRDMPATVQFHALFGPVPGVIVAEWLSDDGPAAMARREKLRGTRGPFERVFAELLAIGAREGDVKVDRGTGEGSTLTVPGIVRFRICLPGKISSDG